jgi:hypothetical protein
MLSWIKASFPLRTQTWWVAPHGTREAEHTVFGGHMQPLSQERHAVPDEEDEGEGDFCLAHCARHRHQFAT